MPRKPVQTSILPTRGPYSYLVEAEPKKLVFVAGLLSVDEQGRPVGRGDMKTEITQIIGNLRRFLGVSGAGLKDIVRVNIYTTNLEEFLRLGKWRAETFPELWSYDQKGPASTAIGISTLATPEYSIEIEATAAL